MNPQVEVQIAGKSGVTEPTGGGEQRPWVGLHVRYRANGARRWSTFLVEAPAGQTLLETIVVAIAVIDLDDATRGHVERASTQLQLDELAGAAA